MALTQAEGEAKVGVRHWRLEDMKPSEKNKVCQEYQIEQDDKETGPG